MNRLAAALLAAVLSADPVSASTFAPVFYKPIPTNSLAQSWFDGQALMPRFSFVRPLLLAPLSLILAGGLVVGAPPSPAPQEPATSSPDAPVTYKQVDEAIKMMDVRNREMLENYQKLRRLAREIMRKYDASFIHPIYGRIRGADIDLRIPDTVDAQEYKEKLFETRALSAKDEGLEYDPALVRAILANYAAIEAYRDAEQHTQDLLQGSFVFNVHKPESLSSKDYRALEKRYQEARDHMEQVIDHLQARLPVRLSPGIEARISESRKGWNLSFNLFGLQIGRPDANIVALQDLTYYQFDPKTGMLQYVQEQAHQEQGTKGYNRTLYEAIRVGISLDPMDLFWGRHIQLRKLEIPFLNLPIDMLMPYRYSFIWKTLPAAGTPEPTEADMKQAVHQMNGAADRIHKAIAELKKSSAIALAENDKRLKVRGRQNADLKRLGLPERGMPIIPGLTEARARLYAERLLSARPSDKVQEQVENPIRKAAEELRLAVEASDKVFNETINTIVYFNAYAEFLPVPVPWSMINRLQGDYLNAYRRVEDALSAANEAEPHQIPYSAVDIVSASGLPPEVIVSLEKWETPPGVDATDYMEEMWFTAPSVEKGIPRYGRIQLILRAWPDGLQEVIQVGDPIFYNGLGTLRYFRAKMLEDGTAHLSFPSNAAPQNAFSFLPQETARTAAKTPDAMDAFYNSDLPQRIEKAGRDLDALIAEESALPSEKNLPLDIQRYLVKMRFHISDSRAAALRDLVNEADKLRNSAETELNAFQVVQVKDLALLRENQEKEVRRRFKEATDRLEKAKEKAIPLYPLEGHGDWVIKRGALSVYLDWVHSGDSIQIFEIVQRAHGWVLRPLATQVAQHLVAEGGWHSLHELSKEIHFDLHGRPTDDSIVDTDFPSIASSKLEPQAMVIAPAPGHWKQRPWPSPANPASSPKAWLYEVFQEAGFMLAGIFGLRGRERLQALLNRIGRLLHSKHQMASEQQPSTKEEEPSAPSTPESAGEAPASSNVNIGSKSEPVQPSDPAKELEEAKAFLYSGKLRVDGLFAFVERLHMALEKANTDPKSRLQLTDRLLKTTLSMPSSNPNLHLARARLYFLRNTYNMKLKDNEQCIRQSRLGLDELKHPSLSGVLGARENSLWHANSALLRRDLGEALVTRWDYTQLKKDLLDGIAYMRDAMHEMDEGNIVVKPGTQASVRINIVWALVDSLVYEDQDTKEVLSEVEKYFAEAKALNLSPRVLSMATAFVDEGRGDFNAALAHYKDSYEAERDDLPARRMVRLLSRRLPEARFSEALEWSRKIENPTPLDLHHRAEILFRMGRLEEASEIWQGILDEQDEQLIKITGELPVLYRGLITCFAIRGDMASAQTRLDDYLKQHKPEKSFARQLVNALADHRVAEQFIKTVRDMKSSQKRTQQLLVMMAATYNERLEAQKVQDASQPPTMKPSAPVALSNRADIQEAIDRGRTSMEAGNFLEANEAFGPVADSSHATLMDYVNITRLYGGSLENSPKPLAVRLAAMQRIWAAAKSMQKDNKGLAVFVMMEASIALGKLFLREDQFDQAETYYRRAITEWKQFETQRKEAGLPEHRIGESCYALFELGWSIPQARSLIIGDIHYLHLSVQRAAEAQQPFKTYVYRVLPNVRAHLLAIRSDFLSKLALSEPEKTEKHGAKATELAQQALDLNPNNSVALVALGRVSLARQHWEDALTNFIKVHEEAPDEGDAIWGALRAQFALAQQTGSGYDAAENWYRKIKKPEAGDYYVLGMIYYRQALYQKAIDAWAPIAQGCEGMGALRLLREVVPYYASQADAALRTGQWNLASQSLIELLKIFSSESAAAAALPAGWSNVSLLSNWIDWAIDHPGLPDTPQLAAFIAGEMLPLAGNLSTYQEANPVFVRVQDWLNLETVGGKKIEEWNVQYPKGQILVRLRRLRAIVEGPIQKAMIAKLYEDLRSALSRLVESPSDYWDDHARRSDIDAWQVEFQKANAQDLSKAHAETAKKLEAQLSALRESILRRDFETRRNEQQGVYDKLRQQLTQLKANAPKSWDEPSFLAQVADWHREWTDVRQNTPAEFVAHFSATQDLLQKEFDELDRQIAAHRKARTIDEQMRVYADLEKQLSLLSSHPTEYWMEKDRRTAIDLWEQDFQRTKGLRAPELIGDFAKIESEMQGNLDKLRDAITAQDEIRASAQQQALRMEWRTVRPALSAVKAIEHLPRLAALEKQIQQLIHRSQEWAEMFQIDRDQAIAALRDAKSRIIPKLTERKRLVDLFARFEHELRASGTVFKPVDQGWILGLVPQTGIKHHAGQTQLRDFSLRMPAYLALDIAEGKVLVRDKKEGKPAFSVDGSVLDIGPLEKGRVFVDLGAQANDKITTRLNSRGVTSSIEFRPRAPEPKTATSDIVATLILEPPLAQTFSNSQGWLVNEGPVEFDIKLEPENDEVRHVLETLGIPESEFHLYQGFRAGQSLELKVKDKITRGDRLTIKQRDAEGRAVTPSGKPFGGGSSGGVAPSRYDKRVDKMQKKIGRIESDLEYYEMALTRIEQQLVSWSRTDFEQRMINTLWEIGTLRPTVTGLFAAIQYPNLSSQIAKIENDIKLLFKRKERALSLRAAA